MLVFGGVLWLWTSRSKSAKFTSKFQCHAPSWKVMTVRWWVFRVYRGLNCTVKWGLFHKPLKESLLNSQYNGVRGLVSWLKKKWDIVDGILFFQCKECQKLSRSHGWRYCLLTTVGWSHWKYLNIQPCVRSRRSIDKTQKMVAALSFLHSRVLSSIWDKLKYTIKSKEIYIM